MIELMLAALISMPTVPGVVNPSVTQSNIATTICTRGYTGTIRPPLSYTENLKRKQMKALKLSGRLSSYEEDHLISLELGGSPTDPNNLWPQPWKGKMNARDKDRLENAMHKLVCSGKITLQQAQTDISVNWQDAYKKYIGAK